MDRVHAMQNEYSFGLHLLERYWTARGGVCIMPLCVSKGVPRLGLLWECDGLEGYIR